MVEKILVTGCAGFIGYHVAQSLLGRGYTIVGIDNLNSYYSVSLKEARLNLLKKDEGFSFLKGDISDENFLNQVFSKHKFKIIIHLAAQAGVRYSIENPASYTKSNLVGFTNLIEFSVRHRVKRFTYASTSSVYGLNRSLPFKESDHADHPIQFYAATKRANELIAHSYSAIHGLETIGFRFFTVYGPWGRPDMALFKFTESILKNKPIEVFNHGNHIRDFTYIDDIVDGIIGGSITKLADLKNWNDMKPDPSKSIYPYRIYNLGNSNPVSLMDYINCLEECLKIKAKIKYLPLQKGDVEKTISDIDSAAKDIKFFPKTNVKKGISNFVEWYYEYFEVKNER